MTTPTLRDLLIRLTSEPKPKIAVTRLNHSSGVMTVVEVGQYSVRWDVIATPALLKHMRNDTDDQFQEFMYHHLQRWIIKSPPADRHISE